MKKNYFFLVLVFILAFSFSSLYANKTSVEIKAPAETAKGTEITIVINVIHSGNSKMHHTDWVYLKVNGTEIKRWEYTKDNLPPDGNFTLEFKYVAEGEMNIEAEGDCNMHGSAGPEKITIKTN